MELNEYQKQAMTTCTESSRNFSYMMMNLVGEVGEFAGKVAKHIRKEEFAINQNDIDHWYIDHDELDALKKELGDILWQLSGLCTVLDFSLEDIAKENLEKLRSRKVRGVIVGNGDNR